jgi:hypothetical protein
VAAIGRDVGQRTNPQSGWRWRRLGIGRQRCQGPPELLQPLAGARVASDMVLDLPLRGRIE